MENLRKKLDRRIIFGIRFLFIVCSWKTWVLNMKILIRDIIGKVTDDITLHANFGPHGLHT